VGTVVKGRQVLLHTWHVGSRWRIWFSSVSKDQNCNIPWDLLISTGKRFSLNLKAKYIHNTYHVLLMPQTSCVRSCLHTVWRNGWRQWNLRLLSLTKLTSKSMWKHTFSLKKELLGLEAVSMVIRKDGHGSRQSYQIICVSRSFSTLALLVSWLEGYQARKKPLKFETEKEEDTQW